MRSKAVVLVICAVVPLAACGDSGSPASSSNSPTSWPWNGTAAVSPTDVRVPGAEFREAPVGEEIPMATTETRTWDPLDPALEGIDPCTLVTAKEFATWAGDPSPPAPQLLEDGEACGFINAADDLRLAIGVITLSDPEGERFVPESAGGEVLSDNIGIEVLRLRWLPDHPVAQSNTLVAETRSFDLVIEISSLGERSVSELRTAAVSFARSAASRLPEGAQS